ncbi:MAG: serine/threonine protein phosphatase [Planctomycetales bacterium]|nr:serine/threonine protein phosphatase [Planctomycetales bacterium]
MPNRVIAIGDIHGCSQALSALLDAIQPQPADTIVTLGDYVDRGPDSPGVIDRLIQLQTRYHLVPILGNHDEMLLEVIRGELRRELWSVCGGDATLKSYGYQGDYNVIPAAHIEFLEQCVNYYEIETHFFVHASYDAGLALEQQSENVLRWRKLTEEIPRPHVSGRIAILGHTPDPHGEIFDAGHLKCIDTNCYGGHWLTALEVTSGQIWQANVKGQLRENAG